MGAVATEELKTEVRPVVASTDDDVYSYTSYPRFAVSLPFRPRKDAGATMAHMVRKQLYLDEAQDRELARRARALGVTQAEVVRRAVDRYLADERPSARASAMEALRSAWARDVERGVGSGGVRPTREELHERER
jgi:hypothetical protein